MNRIETAFQAAKSENRAAFVSYVCAGDPNPEVSLEICRALIENGTDMLELGLPFSDPLADGLTNAQIADRLFIAKGTVRSHLNKLYSKLAVENRVQAISQAQQLGLL